MINVSIFSLCAPCIVVSLLNIIYIVMFQFNEFVTFLTKTCCSMIFQIIVFLCRGFSFYVGTSSSDILVSLGL